MLTAGTIDFPRNNPLPRTEWSLEEPCRGAGRGEELFFLKNYLLPVSLASFKAAGATPDKMKDHERIFFLFLSVFDNSLMVKLG